MSKTDKTGYIYILTNKSFNKTNCIKIGYSDKSNLQERIKQLSNTSVPEPFELFATYEVPKISGTKPDKKIHELIKILNPSLRMNPNKEFFEMEPWDAYEMLKAIATIHQTENMLVKNDKNSYEQDAYTDEKTEYTIDDRFPKGSEERKLFDSIRKIIDDAIPELIAKATKNYVTFKIPGAAKSKCNVVSVWPKSGWIEVVLNAKLGSIKDEEGLIYDISNRKWTSAQYAFKYNGSQDKDVIENLIAQTYKLHMSNNS